jgi:hypothetical protein
LNIKKPEFAPSDADEFLLLDLRKIENCREAVKDIDCVFQFAANMGGIAYITKVGTDIMQFIEHLRNKGNIYPGFVTRNFVKFVDFCEKNDISLKEVIIMAPLNKLGFQMTPSRDECERALKRVPKSNIIAISILAGGRLPLEEGLEYIKSLGISNIAVGVSTASQAKDTFTSLSKILSTK